MGSRPKFEPDLEEVEKLAAEGLSQAQICLCLGIAEQTLYAHKKKNKEFADALKRGQARGVRTMVNHLVAQAANGNTAATIFYLKNRARDDWQDRRVEEIKGGSISINLETGRPKTDEDA